MIRRVLLTGATGLVGGETHPALAARGLEVIPVGRRDSTLPRFRRCELAERRATDALVAAVAPEAIVHLAGGQRGERAELLRDNVLATAHLLEAAAELPRPPFCVVLGSAAEYGAAAGRLAEDAPLQPVTEYGRAKAAQTALAGDIARRGGLRLAVLRPFNLVSPRLPESSALGNVRAQLRRQDGRRRRLRCGRLDVVRDYVPVAAVAEAIVRLVASPVAGVFNVCSGIGIELGDVLAAMAARLGVELDLEIDPALAAQPAPPASIGDPAALLAALGLAIAATPASVAAAVLGES